MPVYPLDYNDDPPSEEASLASASASAAKDITVHVVVDNSPAKAAADSQTVAAAPLPVADEPGTMLVFKDGRQLEVKNYAIQGDLLYDLTGGRPRKIALTDLDLPATQKQNDDRGIDFQLPAVSSVR
jgi:hypothetical protein